MTNNNQQPAMQASSLPSGEGWGRGPFKRCSKCGQEKPISEFYSWKDSRNGAIRFDSKCKKCNIIAVAERRRPGIEKRKAERALRIEEMERSETKTCRVCGRVLPKSEFNKSIQHTGGLNTRCRQCSIAVHRMYRSRKPHPKVTVGTDGRLYNYGTHRTLYWTPQMISDLRRYFPTASNREVSEILGIDRNIIGAKAKELGLSKSDAYMQKLHKERGFMASISRKRNERLRNKP